MDLEQIRKNLQPHPIGSLGFGITLPSLQEVGWLIAEVERLTAEINSRTVSNQDLQDKVSRQASMLADLRSQLSIAQRAACPHGACDDLKGEIGALRAQLSTVEGELSHAKARESNADEGKLHYFTLMQKAETELLQVKGERDRYRDGRPSQRKGLLIEACFIKDCPPFIYGVNGHATISAIEEMEEQLQEDAADVEDGTYLYECYHESAEYGFEGRMEQAAYWQMDQIGYWPLEEDALHPATEAPK